MVLCVCGFQIKKNIMNKRTSILDAARASNNSVDKDSTNYKRLLIVNEVIARYLEIYDMDNGTIHSKVFSMLYLSAKYYTYNAICQTLHISKNTLIRYVFKYDNLALKMLDKLNL